MRFGLIGDPIEHSKSPQLFEELCPDSGDSYELIIEKDFERAFNRFSQDYDAVNVTTPFKELAFRRADTCDEATSILKASNILKRQPSGRIAAYNSDYLGVKDIMEQLNPDKRCALIVGCGGAGRAAALAALDAGYRVIVANRTVGKVEEFISSADLEMEAISLAQIGDYIPEVGIVVYTISTAFDGLESVDFGDCIIFEANYRRPVLSQHHNYIEGMVWLRAQAIHSFRIMQQIER